MFRRVHETREVFVRLARRVSLRASCGTVRPRPLLVAGVRRQRGGLVTGAAPPAASPPAASAAALPFPFALRLGGGVCRRLVCCTLRLRGLEMFATRRRRPLVAVRPATV